MKKLLVLCLCLLAAGGSAAQVPATAPLLIVVGGPAGTPGDTVVRALSASLAAELGQPVVVENRPGASGTVAMAHVARATRDGNTLGIFSLQAAVAPLVLTSLPYDTARDLVPVRQLSSTSNVLVVRSESPLATLDDLKAVGASGALTFASGGNGTPAHLAGELANHHLGVSLRHVPFNGPVAGVAAVVGGHVDLMFAASTSVVQLVQAGRLRAIATTAAKRLAALPQVPTMGEAGWPGAALRDWHGVVAPAGVPQQRLDQLAAALGRALAAAAVQQRLEAAGLEPASVSGPEAFRDLIASERDRWTAVVQKAGIKLQ